MLELLSDKKRAREKLYAVAALRSVLQELYERSSSQPGQRVAGLAGVLEQYIAAATTSSK
jgi:hypothetical protein